MVAGVQAVQAAGFFPSPSNPYTPTPSSFKPHPETLMLPGRGDGRGVDGRDGAVEPRERYDDLLALTHLCRAVQFSI